MKDVVDRILTRRMSICVEVGKWVVAARIDREANFSDQIVSLGRRFRATYRAFEIRVADVKLIVVLRVWLEFLCLDLYPQMGWNSARIEDSGGVPSKCNLHLSLYMLPPSLRRASTPCPWQL